MAELFERKPNPLFFANLTASEKIVVNQGGTFCVSGEVLVETDKGLIPINKIRIGDVVCGSEGWNVVEDVMCYKNTKRTLMLGDLIATEDHKFNIDGRWVTMSELSSTEVFEEYVYDISVRNSHDYYIRANGYRMLSHNSSKSYSIMQVLVALACSEIGRVIVVAGATIPKLKDDVMKIMAEIVGENPNVKRFVKNFNIQDRRYEFTTRSTIEFKSYEDAEDAKGGKFDYLYISEATRFEYATAEILIRNAKFKVFLDYNPTARFWVHDILMVKKKQYPSVRLIRSWHEHNLYLSEEKHREIESIEDPDMWKVYARGLTGKLSGLVFRWSSVEQMPVEGVSEVIWGLDFGYTQDPTALTKVACMKDGRYIVQEITYQAGIAMEDLYEIARRFGYYHDEPIYCDHDKEQIRQLRRLGALALPAEKGEILNGILYLKQQDIRYTADSRNMANELMRYKFLEVNGIATNKPIDAWNHTLDSARYAIYSHRNRKKAVSE